VETSLAIRHVAWIANKWREFRREIDRAVDELNHAGGSQIRLPARVQVLDVCKLVDPAGGHARDRRPVAHYFRIPVHMNDSMNRFLRASRELEKELRRTATNEEISRRMDIPVEKVQKRRTISRDPVSLETPVGRDGESILGDLIEDRWVGSPVDAVIESNVRDETAGILKTLSPKQEKVIRLRFGIGCEREHTLEEIGQEFDVTRERIRQIEEKALRHLRAPKRARRLRTLLAAR
jgi:RNA polymerase primary sigma factor